MAQVKNTRDFIKRIASYSDEEIEEFSKQFKVSAIEACQAQKEFIKKIEKLPETPFKTTNLNFEIIKQLDLRREVKWRDIAEARDKNLIDRHEQSIKFYVLYLRKSKKDMCKLFGVSLSCMIRVLKKLDLHLDNDPFERARYLENAIINILVENMELKEELEKCKSI